MKSRETKRLDRLDKTHLWHPFTQMQGWCEDEQIVIERAKGNYLFDTEGRRFLDGISSLWVTVHGHGRPEIDRAVREQLSKVSHTTLLGLSSRPSIELAEKLVEITPASLKRVFYSDSGSTAVEIALKIAYQYQEQTRRRNKKHRFISFTGAYHGDTIGSMGVGELGVFVDRFKPLMSESIRAPYPYCYRCPVGAKKDYPGCKMKCLGEFERLLKRHHRSVAACIIEPLVQGAAGIVTAPPGFLKGVRRLTKKYDVLLIADEVATGFGRTGKIFACEHERVSPDILCVAKGLTGGYLPVAATITTEKIYKAFLGEYSEYKAFFHGHTYTGNALGCAAAIANLEIFKSEDTIAKTAEMAKRFKKLLAPLKKLTHVGEVRQRGLMCGIELVEDKDTRSRFSPVERVGHRVSMTARERGVIIRPIGDTVILMPPLSIKARELKLLVEATKASIEEITEPSGEG